MVMTKSQTSTKSLDQRKFHKSEEMYSLQVEGALNQPLDAESTIVLEYTSWEPPKNFDILLRQIDLASMCSALMMFFDVLMPSSTPKSLIWPFT